MAIECAWWYVYFSYFPQSDTEIVTQTRLCSKVEVIRKYDVIIFRDLTKLSCRATLDIKQLSGGVGVPNSFRVGSYKNTTLVMKMRSHRLECVWSGKGGIILFCLRSKNQKLRNSWGQTFWGVRWGLKLRQKTKLGYLGSTNWPCRHHGAENTTFFSLFLKNKRVEIWHAMMSSLCRASKRSFSL